jgi:hypothetical protein
LGWFIGQESRVNVDQRSAGMDKIADTAGAAEWFSNNPNDEPHALTKEFVISGSIPVI